MNNMLKCIIVFVAIIGVSLAGCDNGSGIGKTLEVTLEFDGDWVKCHYEYDDGYYINSKDLWTNVWTLTGDIVEFSDFVFQVKLNGHTPANKDELFGKWKKSGSGILEISNAEEDGNDAWWLNGLYSKF